MERDRQSYFRGGHERSEHRPHLLEMQGNVASAFLAGIGDNGEVRRADFYPLGLSGKGRLKERQGPQQNSPPEGAPKAKGNRHNNPQSRRIVHQFWCNEERVNGLFGFCKSRRLVRYS